MPKIVIQVAKYDYPTTDARGRTFAAKVHDTTGTKYTVSKNQPHLAGMFEKSEGRWFEIYAEDKEYRGNPYKEIITANPTTPVTTASAVLRGPDRSPQQHEKDIQIWCNSMLQRAIDRDKIDPWNEDACVEFCEVQKRVFGRIFLGEEAQEVPATNSGRVSPQTKAHPHSAEELDDEVPF